MKGNTKNWNKNSGEEIHSLCGLFSEEGREIKVESMFEELTSEPPGCLDDERYQDTNSGPPPPSVPSK